MYFGGAVRRVAFVSGGSFHQLTMPTHKAFVPLPVVNLLSVRQLTNKSPHRKPTMITKTKEIGKKMSIETVQTTKKIKENTLAKSKELKESFSNMIPSEYHENIYTIPNILTFTRLLSAPIIGYLIVHNHVTSALSLFTYSCITDFIDGYIARKYNMKSVVGTVIDPMADKSLMIICTACMAQSHQIPVYLAVIILGRDVLLGLSAVYYRYVSLPRPKTFKRFWDFSIPSAEVRPTTISKINTGLQMIYIGSAMIKPVLIPYLTSDSSAMVLQGLFALEITVAISTILSGLSYVFSKDAVRILNKENAK
ncbi:BA75_00606T0 [Komagataella pastoris]|uniref:BA75_00606T0 n=1 Tax=Komagataella pastoris TaxID=4922 RepID=A0A1B2J6G1_PICPA|nr:BA75_00606T0 [Komagataella pastoris]